jgi:murein DD-endopeptidase MepM/ murein hydrolase activator NlpD
VVIRHDGGYTTHYASLSEMVDVAVGDHVTLGQTIGTVGSTAMMESALGDHVCFRVTCNGETVNPEDFLN